MHPCRETGIDGWGWIGRRRYACRPTACLTSLIRKRMFPPEEEKILAFGGAVNTIVFKGPRPRLLWAEEGVESHLTSRDNHDEAPSGGGEKKTSSPRRVGGRGRLRGHQHYQLIEKLIARTRGRKGGESQLPRGPLKNPAKR